MTINRHKNEQRWNSSAKIVNSYAKTGKRQKQNAGGGHMTQIDKLFADLTCGHDLNASDRHEVHLEMVRSREIRLDHGGVFEISTSQ